ncbi:MAG: hypothetical protein HGB18_00600 [Candidatus Moranbacteria bacterium]|nr:hypothetical protein [Candidatus Moranbacteria bacterium]
MKTESFRLLPSLSPIASALLTVSVFTFVALPISWYAGLLPLSTVDLLLAVSLMSLAAAYRPGWVFLLLVAVLPLEIVNLAPVSIGMNLRPYQLLTMAVYVGLFMRFLAGRKLPRWPKIHPVDVLLFLVPIGAFLSSVFAESPGSAFRYAIILSTFFAVYWLFRIYIRSSDDLRRMLPFSVFPMILSSVAAIVQNRLFLSGAKSFEVMPGRPDGFFPEPDWLGMYAILFLAFLVSSGYFLIVRAATFRVMLRSGRLRFVFGAAILCIAVLIMTVSRSAWLGSIAVVLTALALPIFVGRARISAYLLALLSAAKVGALALVILVPLSDFDLFGRVASVGSGLQAITVSCDGEAALPDSIRNVEELSGYGCRHIDLEAIDSERASGRFITTVMRSDPNVSIRRDIYARAISLGLTRPVLGVGWGSVSAVLGADERGAGLNASDVFLEAWLGSGLLGLVGLIGFLAWLALGSFRVYLARGGGVVPLFLLSSFSGLVVFDLFNSGILLGYLWALFGIAGSFLAEPDAFTETA